MSATAEIPTTQLSLQSQEHPYYFRFLRLRSALYDDLRVHEADAARHAVICVELARDSRGKSGRSRRNNFIKQAYEYSRRWEHRREVIDLLFDKDPPADSPQPAA